MATMQALIRRRLLADEDLAKKLATYAGFPAIFYQTAPDDTDEGWNQESICPYIVFLMDTRSEAEHDRIGALHVDVICSETGTPPEAVEPLVRDTLSGVFFTPSDGATFVLAWSASDSFKEQANDQSHTFSIGITLTFDVYEFPNMETGDPDPVAALNDWATHWDSDVFVLGRKDLPEIFCPTREHPAFYFRQSQSSVAEQTCSVVWLHVTLLGHFFAPSLHDRIEWIDQFTQELALAGEATMQDGSPLFVQSMKGNAASDELKGQISIEARYGLLRKPTYAHPMTGARNEVSI